MTLPRMAGGYGVPRVDVGCLLPVCVSSWAVWEVNLVFIFLMSKIILKAVMLGDLPSALA